MRAYSEWGSAKVIIDKIEPIHYIRNYLVKYHLLNYSKIYDIKYICEVGCGTGSLSNELGDRGFDVEAFDIDDTAVELAKKFNSNKNVKYFSEDILKSRKSKRYDAAVSTDVLEHIEDDQIAIDNMSLLLKDKGFIFITVPINEKYRRKFDDRSGHIRRYETMDLEKKMNKSGFEVIQIKYFNFPFLWLWYFLIFLPYSDKKENETLNTTYSKKRLPKWFGILSLINKFFLIDLLFNSKYSTHIFVIGRKK
jgi:2-polyprenyl-3-methyl-5-hydroxy-6-metoxy-1,4-benzoquinol methylase